jgi:hypothetical protein
MQSGRYLKLSSGRHHLCTIFVRCSIYLFDPAVFFRSYLINGVILGERCTWHETRILIVLKTLIINFFLLIAERIQRDVTYLGHYVKCLIQLSGFNKTGTICVFIHLVVCLTTGPKPLPKWALHIVRSRASSFKWEYPPLSLRLSNSFLRLLPCLPVTSIPPCIFPSVTRCRRQFLRKMWPIQFAFRLRISCRFLCIF